MIGHSRQGFENLQLKSLLSWAFLRQGKKVKIIEIIDVSGTFR